MKLELNENERSWLMSSLIQDKQSFDEDNFETKKEAQDFIEMIETLYNKLTTHI